MRLSVDMELAASLTDFGIRQMQIQVTSLPELPAPQPGRLELPSLSFLICTMGAAGPPSPPAVRIENSVSKAGGWGLRSTKEMAATSSVYCETEKENAVFVENP